MGCLETGDAIFTPGTFQTRTPLVLDGSPLPANSSIKDFQEGMAGYVADAVEQALLLPDDMTDLRVIKRH